MREHEAGSEDLADFLTAISWSTDPRIMSALRRFLHQANDATQIAAAVRVYGTAHDPRSHGHLLDLADKLKHRRDPAYVEASRAILELALLTFPEQKETTVARFLADAGTYAQTSACFVCVEMEDPPIAALAPLLAIKRRSTGDRYLIKGPGAEKWPKDDDSLPYRICDRAYETIARLLGDEHAVASGTHAEMDTRIESLARRLVGEPPTWSIGASEAKTRKKAQDKDRKPDSK
jgi:hypothetical protein